MLKRPQRFTANKQVVRDLQCESIQKYMTAKLGHLSYFGLPSSSLEDVDQWSPLFGKITAVERGVVGEEWILQHELLLNAFRLGLSRKLTLLRGDIDAIVINGKDDFCITPEWPYDVVSLDYSGGLFYRDSGGRFTRLEAISQLFKRQAAAHANAFVLLLSCNLHNIDQREVRESLEVMRTSLKRYGLAADGVIDAYREHPQEQARLKLYVMNLIAQLSAQAQFDSTSESPLLYIGNKATQMMAFRFFIRACSRTFVPRPPKERLNQIINRRMIEIVDGRQHPTNLKLPLIKG